MSDYQVCRLDRQTEVEKCSFVKMVLMFLVILYHSCLFWADIGWFQGNPLNHSNLLKYFSLWLNSFHVHGFTLVAGYIYYYLRFEAKQYPCFKDFVTNKIKRLLVPYAFISVIWVVPISIYFFDYGISDVFNKYVLATAPSQLWFLWMLFDVFMIVYPLSDWLRNNNKLSFAFGFGLVVIGIACGRVIPNVFSIWTGLSYVIYFLIGFKIRQLGSGYISKLSPLAWFAMHVLLYCFVTYLRGSNSLFFKAFTAFLALVLQVVGAVMAFVVLQAVSNKLRWQDNCIFKKFSNKSMAIYLLHQQIIYFTIYWFNGVVNPYLNAVINFVLAVLGSYIISAVMFRYKPMRVLMGEKG